MPVSGRGPYDDSNIFARILRDEIPSRRIYENEWAVAFHDINPQAPIHVLVIPRGKYVSLSDFVAQAPEAEIAGFFPRGRDHRPPTRIGGAGIPRAGQHGSALRARGAAFPCTPVRRGDRSGPCLRAAIDTT